MDAQPDILDYLTKIAVNGTVKVSIRRIGDVCHMTRKQVRTRIRQLVRDGYVRVRNLYTRDEGVVENEYTVTGLRPPSPTEAARVKAIYCRLVSERTGVLVSTLYSFNGYVAKFDAVALLCAELKLDEHLYLVACFHSFPAAWCRRKFGKPYPPPYLLTNKHVARERYDALIRFIHQHTPEKPHRVRPEKTYEADFETWRALGSRVDLNILRMFIDNGTLSPAFAAAVTQSEKTRAYFVKTYGVTVADLKTATGVVALLLEAKKKGMLNVKKNL